jgi:hypothetical protein
MGSGVDVAVGGSSWLVAVEVGCVGATVAVACGIGVAVGGMVVGVGGTGVIVGWGGWVDVAVAVGGSAAWHSCSKVYACVGGLPVLQAQPSTSPGRTV